MGEAAGDLLGAGAEVLGTEPQIGDVAVASLRGKPPDGNPATDMALPRIYNTLTRQLDELKPITPGRFAIYCCGPTVYDVPHVGHARAAIAPDILVRRLRIKAQQVAYVRNITDVDDKILERAKQSGEPPLELSERMAKIYQQQILAIGCLAPDIEPKVSEHLEPVHSMIQSLLEREHAYLVERPDGRRDVYYSVRSFNGYGKLSRRRIDDLVSGARVEQDELKRDPLDFALWKGASEGEWAWESPWGRGRPGWHIECSAMSRHYLGQLDVHAGGMDLIFPHHENEIAQTEAADPQHVPSAACWMHNGFVNVDKEKMSKSLGNFVTISDVLERNDPEGFRWFLLGVHYRGPIQFDVEKQAGDRVVFPGVDEAERRVDYIYSTLARLDELTFPAPNSPGKRPPELAKMSDGWRSAVKQASDALDEDLNTPVALASLGELAKIGNELCDLSQKRRKDEHFVGAATAVGQQIARAIEEITSWLGLLQTSRSEYRARSQQRRLKLRGLTAEQIETLVEERTQSRLDKDFARSDEIRDELCAFGIVLQDSAVGTQWSIDV